MFTRVVGRVSGLRRTPVELDLSTKVKDEILGQDYFTASNGDDGDPTVVTYPSFPVCEVDIPSAMPT